MVPFLDHSTPTKGTFKKSIEDASFVPSEHVFVPFMAVQKQLLERELKNVASEIELSQRHFEFTQDAINRMKTVDRETAEFESANDMRAQNSELASLE